MMRLNITRLLLSIVVFFPLTASAQTVSDLLISEYVEGSSNNKAIEIYNGTGMAVDLSAGQYILQMYFNGNTSDGTTIQLTGVVQPNSVFVIANAAASFAGSPFVNQVNSASWYNGDDAVVLRKGGPSGQVVDAIGQIGFDPGTEWGTGLVSTADNTLRRKSANCTPDTNPNDVFDPSADFEGFAQDDFSSLGLFQSACVAGPGIVIQPASLTFNTLAGSQSAEQSYVVRGQDLTDNLTINAPSLSSFRLSLTSGGPYVSTLTIPMEVANAGNTTVYVVFFPTSAGLQTGNLSHSSGTYTAMLQLTGNATTTGNTTRIFTLQGNGAASGYVGQEITTEGLVIADFQGASQLGGFFIQDTTGDGDSSTSDGIFVYNTSFAVQEGDYVKLTGTVDEFFNKTEIKNITSLSILGSGLHALTPASVSLPVDSIGYLERFEGMLVQFPQTLFVTENYTLGRYGELSLSVGNRLVNPTNLIDLNDVPSSGTNSIGTGNLAAVLAKQDLNNRSRILLDDASTVQNPAQVPYLNPADTTLRTGSSVLGLTGVMDYDFNVYRVQPTIAPQFNYAARPAVPSVGNAEIKISSFNVLNYFNGDGNGGGFPTSRGADNLNEFNRQRTKIISALYGLDADIVGLTEIENDGDGTLSAIADLVSGLNNRYGGTVYAYISDPTGSNGNSGTDAIKVALIYKLAKVSPVGLAKADSNPVHNRPPLSQLFKINGTNEQFTVIINHFKSKSCTGSSGLDSDLGDGQGCYTDTRRKQAQALITFIQSLISSSGDPDVISLGDYNSYAEEDPLDILRAGGLVQTATDSYSYVFDGQTGSLDYAFISQSLLSKLTGAEKWHINADEPIVKDYNTEFNPAYTFSNDAFRSSDHDPVLLGLRLSNQPPLITITKPQTGSSYIAGDLIQLTASANDPDGIVRKVVFYEGGEAFLTDSVAPYEYSSSAVPVGNYQVTAKAFDNNGDSTVSDTVHIFVNNCAGTGSLDAYGYTNIPGNTLISLSSHPSYPSFPNVITSVNKFEYGPDLDDNYGAKLKGYLCVPVSGYYTFYLASNDQSELWLSSDMNPSNIRRIANVPSNTGFRNWYAIAEQRSNPIYLKVGYRYYVETVHKEGTGSDHLSVAWRLPNGSFEGPIGANRIIPFTAAAENPGSTTRSGFAEEMRKAGGRDFDAVASVVAGTNQLLVRVSSLQSTPATIRVVNSLGQLVYGSSAVAVNREVQVCSLGSKGIYFIEIRQGERIKRLKTICQ